MIKKILTIVGAGAAGAVMIAGSALAASIANGSFENGTDPGSYLTVNSGDSTTITNWTVSQGSVDYIGTYWQPSDGNRSIDLSGNEAGALQQSLATYAGHVYTVSFDMAGNTDGGNAVKTMDVDTGDSPAVYTFNTTGHDKTNMGWQTKTYSFTATGANTVLRFTSMENNPFGPALDNVNVSANSPTSKDQCKNDGWKDYTNPSF